MNPLAAELNKTIGEHAPQVMRLLSDLGKELYFPKGILTQTAEAKQRATRYNATIGEAREGQRAMGLPSVMQHFTDLTTDDVLPYAPSAGRPELRARWREDIREKNPSLGDIALSLPVVTSGITHGLSTVADMFADPGDLVLLPDKLWGNYNLIFGVKRLATIASYPLLAAEGGFDIEGFHRTLKQRAESGKLIVLFNFPNNPTGYSITPAEGRAIRDALIDVCEGGCDIAAVCDDAYFGLFYDEEPMKESLFALLAEAHPRLLAIKLDGASKEDFAWGLRLAFITYATPGGAGMYDALERKTAGCIRGAISNSPNISQVLLMRAMGEESYKREKEEKFQTLKGRAVKVKQVLADPRFAEVWEPYPFNSGYFMCVRLKAIDAEEYRLHLLDVYGVGVISTSATDIRVAISCVDESQIADLFEVMYQCAVEMKAN
jgi:aspartate/methionine/tyrosine aminotransferase